MMDIQLFITDVNKTTGHCDRQKLISVDVAKKITNLKENSAPGLLKFTPRVLKEL